MSSKPVHSISEMVKRRVDEVDSQIKDITKSLMKITTNATSNKIESRLDTVKVKTERIRLMRGIARMNKIIAELDIYIAGSELSIEIGDLKRKRWEVEDREAKRGKWDEGRRISGVSKLSSTSKAKCMYTSSPIKPQQRDQRVSSPNNDTEETTIISPVKKPISIDEKERAEVPNPRSRNQLDEKSKKNNAKTKNDVTTNSSKTDKKETQKRSSKKLQEDNNKNKSEQKKDDLKVESTKKEDSTKRQSVRKTKASSSAKSPDSKDRSGKKQDEVPHRRSTGTKSKTQREEKKNEKESNVRERPTDKKLPASGKSLIFLEIPPIRNDRSNKIGYYTSLDAKSTLGYVPTNIPVIHECQKENVCPNNNYQGVQGSLSMYRNKTCKSLSCDNSNTPTITNSNSGILDNQPHLRQCAGYHQQLASQQTHDRRTGSNKQLDLSAQLEIICGHQPTAYSQNEMASSHQYQSSCAKPQLIGNQKIGYNIELYVSNQQTRGKQTNCNLHNTGCMQQHVTQQQNVYKTPICYETNDQQLCTQPQTGYQQQISSRAQTICSSQDNVVSEKQTPFELSQAICTQQENWGGSDKQQTLCNNGREHSEEAVRDEVTKFNNVTNKLFKEMMDVKVTNVKVEDDSISTITALAIDTEWEADI